MSKGPGRLQLIIAQLIENDAKHRITDIKPALCLSTWNVAWAAYHPGYANPRATWNWRPSRTQLQSATRAMHGFVRRHQRYALAGGMGRKMLFLYEPDNERSACMVRLRLASRQPVPLIALDRYLSENRT